MMVVSCNTICVYCCLDCGNLVAEQEPNIQPECPYCRLEQMHRTQLSFVDEYKKLQKSITKLELTIADLSYRYDNCPVQRVDEEKVECLMSLSNGASQPG